jgi:spectinomycin phosphotransferase
MKEKPNLPDEFIVSHIRDGYGLDISQVEFLPIGYVGSAKYRLVTHEQGVYFLKLVKGYFREISVIVPHFLHEQGISQVISPVKTKDARFWTKLGDYTCLLYPFIEGQNGFQHPLSDDQWIAFGAALKKVHSIDLPPDFLKKIPFDTFSPDWRVRVREFLVQAENKTYEDPTEAKMAAGLREHSDEIRFVIERAESLGTTLQSQFSERVLCHTDIHAGNLLLDKDGALYMIDWDDPMVAPKERDLMFIGGGIGGIWNTPREERQFFQGYGGKNIDLTALTYYRYERIVSDVAEFCQQVFSAMEGDADRERSLQKYYSIFLPGQVLEMAYKTDQVLKSEGKVKN